jgi:co-chaperonin GroES (HSP10)
MAIKPLGNRVLIEEFKVSETKTKGGIIIGDVQVPQSIKVKILALGEDVKGFEVEEVVFVSQFAPTETAETAADKTMVIPAKNILAKIVKD